MKTFQKCLTACLLTVMVLSLFVLGAFAETATQDGLTVELTTDKATYGAGESITAILTVTNTNNVPMQSVVLKQLVPAGYQLSEGQTDTKSVMDLQPGQSVSLSVMWTGVDQPDEGFDLMKFYENNKTLVHIVGIALGGILLVVLVALGIHKLRYSFIALVLCTTMLFGAVSGTVVQVQALEPVEGSVKVSATVTADGKEVKLEGTADYSMEPEVTTEAVCTVTFDTMGGSAVEPQQVDNGGLAVRPDVPTREGHVFVGWYADAELENLFDFATPITSSCTVYAYWINTEDETDTDGDGLTDELERYFGTDKEKVDTDGDGLSDYVEVMVLNYDPLKTDTDGNGTTDDREDIDQDGLDNRTEMDKGTDCFIVDTDQDGLTDKDEVETYHTDPLKSDTDNDGFFDGWEIENGTDPFAENQTLDVTETVEMMDVTATLDIHLNGEQQQSLKVENSDDSIFMNTVPGQISSALSLTMEGDLPESGATLSFAVGEEFPQEVTEDFVPVIYYYNPETFLLEEVPTTYVNGVATTHLTHFSTYILLNKVLFDEVWETEIKPPDAESSGKTGVDVVFVVDSSGSMSSNDRQDIRITAVKNFIDKLGEKDRAAIVDFDSYASLFQSFTNDHEKLYTAINRVNDSGNTNLSKGMNLAIQQFTDSSYIRTDAFKYIIFLTDGDGSYSTGYTQSAADNGIVVYTVGLGSGVNASVLKGIANGTGGKYYFASEADDLIEIYDQAIEETIDYSTDSNDDGISDYYTKLLCEGKLLNGAGQSYFDVVDEYLLDKYPDMTVGEIMYMLFQENNDYDGDGLKNGQEVFIVEEKSSDKKMLKVYAMAYSDPRLIDTDSDGREDLEEREDGTDPQIPDLPIDDVYFLCTGKNFGAGIAADQYKNNPALVLALHIENKLLGGDMIFTKVAEQELLNVVQAYSGVAYESLKDRVIKSVYSQIYKALNDSCEAVLHALSSTEEYYDELKPLVDELKRTTQEVGNLIYKYVEAPDPSLTWDEYKQGYAQIDDAIAKCGEAEGAIKKVTNIKDVNVGRINIPIPNWLNTEKISSIVYKCGGVVKKIGNAAQVISIVYSGAMSVLSWIDTIEGFASLYANDITNDIVDEWLNEIVLNSEINYVRIAAADLHVLLTSNNVQFKDSIIRLSLKAGTINEFDEVVISLVLPTLGIIGWVATTIRILAAFGGIGNVVSDYIHTVALGEAGRHASEIFSKSVLKYDSLSVELADDTMKYYKLLCHARLLGEQKCVEFFSAAEQSPIFNGDGETDYEGGISELNSNCSKIRTILKKTKNYQYTILP